MSRGHFQGELKSLRDLHVMRYKLNEAINQLDAFSITTKAREIEFNEVKNENLIVSHSRHLAKLKNRYTKLNKRIKSAFSNPAGHGLASDIEQDQLKSFVNVSSRINSLSKKKSIEEYSYQQRLNRVEGVLKWSLSERYSERKAQVSKNLALLQFSIKKASDQLEAAKFAYQVAPKSYKGFDTKIAKLRLKYEKQLSKLELVYQEQREKVGGIVKADIKVRQDRVMDYQLQARLAAARLFDETSNKVRSVATGEVRQ